MEEKMENEMETVIKLGIIDIRMGTVAPTVGPVLGPVLPATSTGPAPTALGRLKGSLMRPVKFSGFWKQDAWPWICFVDQDGRN